MEPKALQWLTAGALLNHHTLSDFRITETKKLERLFSQVLAVLDQDGLIDVGHLYEAQASDCAGCSHPTAMWSAAATAAGPAGGGERGSETSRRWRSFPTYG